MFFNEDFSVKDRLVVGNPSCIGDHWGKMYYNNPDSIYFAYDTETEYGSTVSIACFSSDGILHFDKTLDLPKPPEGSVYSRGVWGGGQALSNGGVLINGFVDDVSENFSKVNSNGFLLYYHPTKDVGIVETDNYPSLRVYPNPAKNQLTVECRDAMHCVSTVEIYSVVGQVVQQGTLQGESTTINVKSLAAGMYYLKVNNMTVKFMKE